MAFPIVEVTCSDTGQTVKADVLNKTAKSIKVALGMGGQSLTLTFKKNDPNDRYYVGNKFRMEFTTTGEEV